MKLGRIIIGRSGWARSTPASGARRPACAVPRPWGMLLGLGLAWWPVGAGAATSCALSGSGGGRADAAAGVAAATATRPGPPAGGGEGEVVVAPLAGDVSQAQFIFLRRVLKDAEAAGAAALVLEMDTYGGALDAAVKMQDALTKTALPTYTFINPNAGSAGALIAVSTKRIYMAPVSAIGAAAPVLSTGQEMPTTMTDKMVSYFSGYFRSAAERNGHNPDIAEAFINKEKPVKIGEEAVHEKGSVLTLSAQEAVREVGGKPLLAQGVVGSVADLVRAAGLPERVRRIEPTGFEQLAFWITALAPLFLLGGIIGGYIEFKTPGFGVPGVVSVVCFAIFFLGHYLAGLAGWEVFALFCLGVALVFVELILLPGLIVPGVLGVCLILGTLLWAMVDRYPMDPVLPSPGALVIPLLNLGITAVAALVLIFILAQVLPKSPLYGKVVLGAAGPRGASLAAMAPARHVAVGAAGMARSALRPSGRAEFGEVVVDVVTQGEFLAAGTALRVVGVEGARVVVEAA